MITMRHGEEYAEMDGGKPDNTVSGSFRVITVTSPDSKTSITRADKLKAINEKAKS